jgi:hypothetical protein
MKIDNEHSYQELYKFSNEPLSINTFWTTSRKFKLDELVRVVGFEPTTLWSQTRCANQTALHSDENGAPSRNRTSD